MLIAEYLLAYVRLLIMKQSINERGVVHRFRGKTNCSKRTQLAAESMKLKLNLPVTSRSEKIKQRRKRIKGKNARVEGLDVITPTNYCFAAEKLETYSHFFTHKKKEDFLKDNNDYLANFKKKFKIKFLFPEMIIDNITGSKMMESANVPVYIYHFPDNVVLHLVVQLTWT